MPNTPSTPPAAANNTAPSQPGAEPRLISAVSADGASPQFKIPVSSQAIQSVESVDLDLVLTTTTGEKIILQQGALQAATAPDSKIVFQNGDSITAADQIKKLGVLKPVEGGSFRLKSGDASPAVAELVTGDGFGLGKELQDTMSQLTETSKQLEKVLQTLSTATLSNTADDSKPITVGPGTGTGVQKITPQSENKFASPSPGSPPQPEVEVEKFTSNNTDTNSLPAKVSVSMLAANQNGVTYQNNALGKTEVRQFLGKTTVELTMTDKAQALEFSAGKVDNQLLLADVPNTNALILSINTQQIGFKIPEGLTINGQAVNAGTPLTINVSGMKNNSVPLNLQWNEGSSAASSDFQMSVAYVGPNGQINLKTITFTGKAEYAYTLDANGEPRQFIASQADNLVVTANNEDNTITLGNGADTIKGSGGADTINGGAGKDTVDYSASTAAVNVNVSSGSGTGGQAQGDQLNNIETLTGSSASDTLDFSGASTAVTANLIQGTSNQKLNGSAQDLSFSGFENVVGSANDDHFVASSAANDLKGGTGSDTVDYSNSAAVVVNLHTGVGRDNHAAGDTYNSIENLIGGAGNDTFFASEAANSFTGNGGVNRVNYEHSTAGVTVNLFTGKGSGGFAKDDSYATIQNATGSNFNDTFVANNQANNFVGGYGTDTVSYENATGAITVNLLNNTGSGSNEQGDTYSSIENAVGGAGSDTFISGSDANSFDGKGGNNTVSYAGSTEVKVNLETGEVNGGNAVGDTFVSIQNLTGGDGADALTGDGQANTLTGGAGNDTLDGGAGDDTLMGGAGADRFTGGTGTDTASYADSSAISIDINFNGTGTSRGTGNAAGDVIGSDIERVQGSGRDDTFFGTRTGVLLDGGTGTDSIDFSGTTSGATLNLGDTTQFVSIERVVGSNNNDNLTASNSGSTFVTQNGNDTLTGGTGADFFNLDTGNTTLVGDVANGGGGDDTFVIRQSTVSGSVVNLDGGSGSDTLRVIAGATLDLSNLNAKNFEKIDLRGDGVSTQASLSKTDILALVDSGSKTLTLRLDSTDSYVIEPESGINVTQGQSVSFYNGTVVPDNLVAQVNFVYA